MTLILDRTITVRGLTAAQVTAAVRSLPDLLSGRAAPTTAVQKLLVGIGQAALKAVADEYLVKARGGTDAAGLKWQDIKPQTRKRKLKRWQQPGILRQTDHVLKSLLPAGTTPGATLPPPSPTPLAVPGQVFKVGAASVTLGTAVPYAIKHHQGDPLARLPQRRLWPRPARWTSGYWRGILQATLRAMPEIVAEAVGGRVT